MILFLSTDDKKQESFQNVTNNCPTTWGKTHFPYLQVFHLHHKQVLTIHTSVLAFDYKQINLRPWAKPVSHTPDTPLSVSSQIFSQVDIHLFCRVNNEAYLQAIFLSTAVLNNYCNNNQFFIALIIFRCTFQKEKNIYL